MVWKLGGGVMVSKLKPIFMIQKKCVKNIAGKNYTSHTDPLFYKSRILKIHDLLKYNTYCFMYKYANDKCPTSFKDFFTPFGHENRTKQYKLTVPRYKNLEHFPSYQLAEVWNGLGLNFKRLESLKSFKSKVKTMLLDKYK